MMMIDGQRLAPFSPPLHHIISYHIVISFMPSYHGQEEARYLTLLTYFMMPSLLTSVSHNPRTVPCSQALLRVECHAFNSTRPARRLPTYLSPLGTPSRVSSLLQSLVTSRTVSRSANPTLAGCLLVSVRMQPLGCGLVETCGQPTRGHASGNSHLTTLLTPRYTWRRSDSASARGPATKRARVHVDRPRQPGWLAMVIGGGGLAIGGGGGGPSPSHPGARM
ncbi:hypothetical protein DFH27DRAFT_532920 [Peziza echinospora]|nr:hypothetical protein DFH27DRAFT_532920 [Peziza echinospora]